MGTGEIAALAAGVAQAYVYKPPYPRRVPGLALAGVSSARHQAPGTMLPQQPGPDASRRLRRVLVRLAPLACLLGLLVLAYAMGWHRNLTLQTLVENNAAIDEFIAAHRIAAILSFVVIYAIGAILAMPAGAVLAVVGGFLFGALIGGAAAMIGSTLGATAVFLIARSAFGERLLRRLGPRVESFAAGFRADAFYYVMFLRLMPVPSWFTNLTAALFEVRLRTFVGATAIGRIPGSFLLALFGAGLDSMIDNSGSGLPRVSRGRRARLPDRFRPGQRGDAHADRGARRSRPARTCARSGKTAVDASRRDPATISRRNESWPKAMPFGACIQIFTPL